MVTNLSQKSGKGAIMFSRQPQTRFQPEVTQSTRGTRRLDDTGY
jgi:hypothetical protein